MRMMMTVKFPHNRFNDAVRDGNAGSRLETILAAIKPEAVYFTEMNGQRGAVLLVNLDSPSQIPALAEPWFLAFDADVHFQIAMTPDDLKEAGLDQLGRTWA